MEEHQNYRKIILKCLEKFELTVGEMNKIEQWLNTLIDNDLFLQALENNGVDNWTWYSAAVDEYRRLRDVR